MMIHTGLGDVSNGFETSLQLFQGLCTPSSSAHTGADMRTSGVAVQHPQATLHGMEAKPVAADVQRALLPILCSAAVRIGTP